MHTQTVPPFKFGNELVIHPTHYWACDYLSMMGLKLIHVNKRGPKWRCLLGYGVAHPTFSSMAYVHML